MKQHNETTPLSYLNEETLFNGLANAAPNVYLFKADIQAGYSIWSDNAITYFGFPLDYQTKVTDFWISRIHPDDVKGYTKDISAVFSGKKKNHYYQYRVMNALGEYVWVECVGNVIVDEPTQNEVFVGLVTRLDVTGKYDSLTNCLNLKEFYLTKFDQNCLLLLIGMDGFRKVINQIGFDKSNHVLAILGEVLQKHSQINRVYRMTGDEFLVVLPPQNKEELSYFFYTIQKEFKLRINQLHTGLRVNFSGGVCHYNIKRDTKEDAIHRLEHSIDYAKSNHPGSYAIYSSQIEEFHNHIAKLQAALTESIENNFEGFELYYQPIFDNKNHQIFSAEALLRFYHPEFGMVSPSEFIPLLEASGDIVPIGMWVAEQAIQQKVQWFKKFPNIHIGFNVSLLQLQNRVLPEYIVDLIQRNNIDPHTITVELTESHKMNDPHLLRQVLQPLVDAGVDIFLDDFGMEASTFSLVQELPVNGIKIDHSFVRVLVGNENIRTDIANKAIVLSIKTLARELKLAVIAEGVETENIKQLLSEMDINLMQGYHFSRPIPVSDFEEKYYEGEI